MTKLTLAGLEQLRKAKREELRSRLAGGKESQVIIGMGTCGIAAGAQETLAAFLDEIKQSGLANVTVRPTGCMGLCYSEPTVEVRVPEMPAVVYGKVNAEVARRIVRKHIIGKLLINDHIYDKPAADLLS